ncbi:hypothetical protein GGQ92_002235 [Gracilibacillus halotolerans]|uniref:DUF2779 domain-containing protein n=1 Tax=Gracilibacillus halotolerans TaxID=74386 RepID=A0A841RP73_9BACI|nr:DUF2779 domain-containing protein [Gracilibacillus halotolerans]MBB6513423.1 hypothetical protein [Gracilibacillus halotolerans]
METRYLTKSHFKLAMECPTKLFYIGKEEYSNNNLEDPFLEALSKGGFQVGELAKAYYPGGQTIDTLDNKKAVEETSELLKQKNCIIYEAALKYEDYLIRVDILVKQGNDIKLIEVKAKSIDYNNENKDTIFVKTRGKDKGGLKSDWKPFIQDVAFQTYVAEKTLPDNEITPYLMLVNKNAKSPSDGLNQKFKISKNSDGANVTSRAELTEEERAEKLLIEIDMNDKCHQVMYKDKYKYLDEEITFSELIKNFAANYKKDQLIKSKVGFNCKSCEFKASDNEMERGLKSGYHECFKRDLNWKDEDFEEDTIFDLWKLHYQKRDLFIEENRLKFSQLKKEEIVKDSTNQLPLAGANRQWIQIEKSVNNDTSYEIDKENLKNEMEKWTFPLHFIDFETAQPVIPFNKGRSPFEGIAFQFSHHMVHEDGTIEHKSQYLNTEPGVFPNYEFVRNLKSALENDHGTIFRYATHENTYLNVIYDQLKKDMSYIEDKEELCEFIRNITQKGPKNNRTEGPRNMVDLWELVQNYYYDPYMKGSNSIKVVLPAILNSSDYIKEKYSKPIYGAKEGIKSLNFENQVWVQFEENGQVTDPYKLLPQLFTDLSEKDLEYIDLHEDLNNGGAAMVAYERLQFENIPQYLREEVEKGMLKYCELDTLAMVMIYEAWADMVK